MKEEWKTIWGYNGYYEISNHGRVRSLDRKIYIPSKDCHIQLYGQIRKLKFIQQNDKNLGLYVGLTKEGVLKYFKVARLVLETFVCPPPKKDSCALHKDGDMKNANVENLFWGSMADLGVLKIKNNATCAGTKHRDAKLNEDQVREIRRKYDNGGITQRQLGNDYGMSQGAIQQIVERTNWTHVK